MDFLKKNLLTVMLSILAGLQRNLTLTCLFIKSVEIYLSSFPVPPTPDCHGSVTGEILDLKYLRDISINYSAFWSRAQQFGCITREGRKYQYSDFIMGCWVCVVDCGGVGDVGLFLNLRSVKAQKNV